MWGRKADRALLRRPRPRECPGSVHRRRCSAGSGSDDGAVGLRSRLTRSWSISSPRRSGAAEHRPLSGRRCTSPPGSPDSAHRCGTARQYPDPCASASAQRSASRPGSHCAHRPPSVRCRHAQPKESKRTMRLNVTMGTIVQKASDWRRLSRLRVGSPLHLDPTLADGIEHRLRCES